MPDVPGQLPNGLSPLIATAAVVKGKVRVGLGIGAGGDEVEPRSPEGVHAADAMTSTTAARKRTAALRARIGSRYDGGTVFGHTGRRC